MHVLFTVFVLASFCSAQEQGPKYSQRQLDVSIPPTVASQEVHVTVVKTKEHLLEALEKGAHHIELQEHVDLTQGDKGSDLLLFVDIGGDFRSIRVRYSCFKLALIYALNHRSLILQQQV